MCSCAAIFKRKNITQRNCAPRKCLAISFAREPLSIYNQNIIRCLEMWPEQVEKKTENTIYHLNPNRRKWKKKEKQIHNSSPSSAISFSDYFSFVRFHLRAVRAPLIFWCFFLFSPCIMSAFFFVGFCLFSRSSLSKSIKFRIFIEMYFMFLTKHTVLMILQEKKYKTENFSSDLLWTTNENNSFCQMICDLCCGVCVCAKLLW